jgi:hypothetical protein
MASLAEIRARIAAAENKGQNKGSNTQSDNAIYPHWNIDEGTTATVRFLPDADPNNTFFWIERQVIKLPFNGIKGDADSKQVTIQVPCVEMYGDNCPILAEVRPWYKDDSLKDMANKYWKKRSYIYQGFVRQNPIGDDKTPANPIRRFVVTSQIQTIIKASLMDPEMEELPTDYTKGLDFNVRKTSGKGGYAEYTTSSWARKETSLTEAEMAAIEAHGLYNLADFLPKKPSEAELRIIKEMFDASVDGRPYDTDKWGAYYRPYGVDAPAGTATDKQTATAETRAPVTAPTTVTYSSDPDDVPFETDQPIVVPTTTSSDKAQDILAMIRARQPK